MTMEKPVTRRCVACKSAFDHSDQTKVLCRMCENALDRMKEYVAPVVRCENCTFSTDGYICNGTGFMMPPHPTFPDWFCSCGERRE